VGLDVDAVIRVSRVIGGAVSMAPSPVAPYAGPGDVVSGAAAWWGLRAYTKAGIGANAIRLRRDGASPTEQDFVTVSPGGGLDISSITSFKGSDNLFVVKLYDQTGNSHDQAQTTTANQPGFSLGILGSLPSMVFEISSSQYLVSVGATITSAQPFQASVVARSTPTLATGGSISTTNTSMLLAEFDASAIRMYVNGTSFSPSVTQNVWHAVQSTVNGASSVLYIDGSSNSGTVDTTGLSSDLFYMGNDAFSSFFRGNIMEGGIWLTPFSGTDNSNMNTNQHNYYGF